MDEAKKRDYKAEYKKFQSSTKSKKYRAELNKYNRQKGTYGNGDGKDASHKGGKIVGFESQSKNRGRAEKSRLKKESKIREGIKFSSSHLKQLVKAFKGVKGGVLPSNHPILKQIGSLLKQADDKTLQHLKGANIAYISDIAKNLLGEVKITEDFKNNKWEVYVADEKGREKIVKVAKSKRAGVILYNRLINTDKYHEVGMRVIKEGKLTESDELQRWKVYIKGEKQPLILTGKNANEVKKFAYQMIRNNKVKIKKVVKEGFGGSLKGKKKLKFQDRIKELSTQLGYTLVEGKLNEFNKKHFLKLFADEAKSLIGQKKYVQKALKSKDLEDWERKEYDAVYKEILKRQKELKIRINNVSQMSEGKLNELGTAINTDLGANSYIHPDRKENVKNQGVYLQGFSNKEASKIIDGNLKNWVKSLRKVEGNVIKDWMNGAKSGQIDFFDIIRGLKTGDIARAHPYETDFLTKLLSRDKIIDRFRSYFKGKKGKSGRRK